MTPRHSAAAGNARPAAGADAVHSEPVPPLAAKSHLVLTRAELTDWGSRLGREATPPLVIAITGELGAGKTTLAQAICAGYGVRDDVTSPTFTLVHEYSGTRSKVYHLDLYRLKSWRDLERIGWDDILGDHALVIVEWPERAADLMPPGHIPISLSYVADRPDDRLLYAGGHT
jgi:tRNA threonylcarbamoyladenosine biosynthesis protein TsaE